MSSRVCTILEELTEVCGVYEHSANNPEKQAKVLTATIVEGTGVVQKHTKGREEW